MKIATLETIGKLVTNIKNTFVTKTQYETDIGNINSSLQDINTGLDEIIGE